MDRIKFDGFTVRGFVSDVGEVAGVTVRQSLPALRRFAPFLSVVFALGIASVAMASGGGGDTELTQPDFADISIFKIFDFGQLGNEILTMLAQAFAIVAGVLLTIGIGWKVLGWMR